MNANSPVVGCEKVSTLAQDFVEAAVLAFQQTDIQEEERREMLETGFALFLEHRAHCERCLAESARDVRAA